MLLLLLNSIIVIYTLAFKPVHSIYTETRENNWAQLTYRFKSFSKP